LAPAPFGTRAVWHPRRSALAPFGASAVSSPFSAAGARLFMPDTQLRSALSASYVIERELGRGGMATVYLARDVKHQRPVALKLLHPELSAVLGPERFLKEIELTASLQHPHILPLFDSGNADGQLFYVMPFVEGETLRGRLERERQLPVSDAVRIAREVADALAYAHARGVIHRDIKPENILLHGGHALVADFGIALAVQQAGGQRMTQTGLSLGTPQYMAPEQAMGDKAIDLRADIYALGVVTYEMLAGEPPFTGPTAQAIVARVLTTSPVALRQVRDTVPIAVERAVTTALAKLPADRFADAAEFSSALVSTTEQFDPRTNGAARSRTTRSMPTTAILGVALATATAFAAWGWLRPAPPAGGVTRVAIAMPAAQQIQPAFWGFSFDVSPDGRRLAYIGAGPSRGSSQVWIRPLDALDATALTGTVGAVGVQWSPDARRLLVMMTRQQSVVVAVDGGQVATLRDAYDASWGSDGRIYFDSKDSRILRQSVGGVPDTLYRGDTTNIMSNPTALPGGDGVLFARVAKGNEAATRSEIVGVSFATQRATVVGRGVYARVLPSGSLLFAAADGGVFLAPFDQKNFRMTGAPTPLVRVAMGANSARSYPQISLANEGTFLYLAGDLERQRLTWLDANGRLARRLSTEGDFWGVSLSPDGSRVAYTLRTDNRDPRAAARGTGDAWVEDIATGARTRLTSEWFNPRPSWSPDGKFVLYTRVGGPLNQAMYERRADASEPERLVVSMQSFGHSVGDGRWLPDHSTLLVRTYLDNGGQGNIYYTKTGGADSAHVFVATPAAESAPTPSPDGTLVAYVSDETGTNELYVQRFPLGGERLAVSHGEASPPRWSRDGRSLYFWNQRGKLEVASIASRPALVVTGVREIDTEIIPGGMGPGRSNYTFDVAPDGRILVAEAVRGAFDLVLVRDGLPSSARGPSKSP
jgi:serine/threonine-protein kinase